MKIRFIFFLILTFAPVASFADFGEIDIIVQESIEDHFDEEGRPVDLSTLTYEGDPKMQNDIMVVETSVKAVQGYTHEWGLHYCTTKIKVLATGKFKDQGSDCYYDTDQ